MCINSLNPPKSYQISTIIFISILQKKKIEPEYLNNFLKVTQLINGSQIATLP